MPCDVTRHAMWCLWVAASVLWWTIPAAGDGGRPSERIVDVTYVYSKPPHTDDKGRGDPKHTKLVNGVLENSDEGMIWTKMAAG